MWWHTVTHGRESEGETGEWSGYPVLFTLPWNMVYPAFLLLVRTTRLPAVDWNDAPADLNRLGPFRRKTKSGFCACAITFQTQSNKWTSRMAELLAIIYGSRPCASHDDIRGEGGGGGLATLIINLDTRQSWLVRFTFPPLHPCDSQPYVLNTRLAGPQSPSGCSRDDRKITNQIDKLRCYFENGFLLTNCNRGLIYAYLLHTPYQQEQRAVKFVLKIPTLAFLRHCQGSQHKVSLQKCSDRTDKLHRASENAQDYLKIKHGFLKCIRPLFSILTTS
jgi:hypothetical protein